MKAPGTQSISVGQLAILYISYMVGSSIVYVPNPIIHYAGNMAWLSLAAATLMSMLVLGLCFTCTAAIRTTSTPPS